MKTTIILVLVGCLGAGAVHGEVTAWVNSGTSDPRHGPVADCKGYEGYSQPLDPANFSIARTSDAESGFVVVEDFVDARGVITPLMGWASQIRWWGINFDFVATFCTDDDDAGTPFDLKFYSGDAAGPGPELVTVSGVSPVIVDTGIPFAATTIKEYSATFPEVEITGATWVSIQRQEGVTTCQWLWVDENLVGSYDDMAFQDPGGVVTTDHPLCLNVGIPGGEDCWSTACGKSRMTFCGADGNAIPADFFDPGSEPFEGEILFGGSGKQADTVLRRLEPLMFPKDGSPAQSPIELVELDLVGCEPIVVVTNGQEELWSVAATLSETSAGVGSIQVLRTQDNGGVFDAVFPLYPLLTFTRVSNPTETRTLDTALLGPPFQFATVGQAPWVSETLPGGPLVCGVGFVPGVQEDPVTGEQCCRKIGHASSTDPHLHETEPPDCSECPTGACCDPEAGTCTVVQTSSSCPGDYKGDGTDCTDSDQDGIPDVLELNSCCSDTDACHRGTDPTDPDTDGDGVDDGTELAMGTDPCVSDVIFEDGFESGDTSAWTSAG